MKANLRREMIARRDALSGAERASLAQALAEQLARLPQYTKARSVLATMSIGSEWNTRVFLERAMADGKVVVLPRISAPPRKLELYGVADLSSDLIPGTWDIPEPDPARCGRLDLAEVDFALVPALAIDAGRHRLGYGAGYFDKLLAGRGAHPFCVTALPAAFVVESLPHESHDIPVDLVVNEHGPVTHQEKAR
ncbi:MAG: 5-formyltetrahydrofolate cyclo-ligase [Usitatibacter sp.]